MYVMSCMIYHVCKDSQLTTYMKPVDTSLFIILIAKNANANEFQ